MSGKTRIKNIGVIRARSSSETLAENSVGDESVRAESVSAVSAKVPGQSAPGGAATLLDPVQTARDLEDAARAYTEVVQVLEAITRSTQGPADPAAAAAINAMATHLESAWSRWDDAHRRLIGAERRTTVVA
ncbi:MAG: hypothetical protein ACT4P1_14295 [Sporichthyaceae bacterium]